MFHVIEIHDYMFKNSQNYFLVYIEHSLFENRKSIYDYFASKFNEYIELKEKALKPLYLELDNFDSETDKEYNLSRNDIRNQIIDKIKIIESQYTKQGLKEFIKKDNSNIIFHNFSTVSICFDLEELNNANS